MSGGGGGGGSDLPSSDSHARHRQQLPPSRVPHVIANVNSHEEQRLRRSLAQLEQQRSDREAADAGWLRAFAVRQTVRSQKLHQLGFARSLELLPDSLLTNYGDTLIGVAKQPLLARIAALAQQQKRLKRAMNGGSVRRSVSLGASLDSSGGADVLTDDDDETLRHWLPEVAESPPTDQSRAREAARLALPAVVAAAAQPIGQGRAPRPIGDGLAARPIGEQRRAAPAVGAAVRLPLMDPRFLQLVGSLECKSAWKRKYIPPSTGTGATATEGNSLDELVNSYYSK